MDNKDLQQHGPCHNLKGVHDSLGIEWNFCVVPVCPKVSLGLEVSVA